MAKAFVKYKPAEAVGINLTLDLQEAQGLLNLFCHIAGGVVRDNHLYDIFNRLEELREPAGLIGSSNLVSANGYISYRGK